MGLIGGMARTAVVAGTATAVSNRVSRRQAGRWAAQDQQQYEQEQAYAQPAPAAPTMDDQLTRLKQLGDLRDQGILSNEEFEAQKRKILGT